MQIKTSNNRYEFVTVGDTHTFEHVAIAALADMDSGDTAFVETSTQTDDDYTQYSGYYCHFSGHLVA